MSDIQEVGEHLERIEEQEKTMTKADHDHEFEDRCYCGVTAHDYYAQLDA